MMFSLSFAVFLFLIFGINGQTTDIDTFRPNNLEKGYPFGKLRLAEEGKNEELIATVDISKTQLNQDQLAGVQPLPSPCIGAISLQKRSYPKEKTKYIQCRDEFHYEIFTCPNGGEYNEQTNSCDLILPMIDKCEQEKPCLNDGHCILLSNSSFKCTCRQDWTGDRCETPVNSCVMKPCGPNAECRTLKTTDYEQDYVCVCSGTKGYGLNCQEVVSNPCLTTSEQFFPYAFSQRAYIQCDGDLIYFQPCGPLLYWNQEEKICDRKRPPKIDLPALLLKYISNNNENQQENINEEIIGSRKTSQNGQQNSYIQNGNENVLAFVPARVANRQQLQANINNQQGFINQNFGGNEQQTQQFSNQLSQSGESNQIRQGFMSQAKQWPNQQQQWKPTLTEASSINSNIGQSQIRQDNQQQYFPQQNRVFGSQQWLNQISDVKPQNNPRFGSQSQIIQNQPQLQAQDQQTFFETSTAAAQNIIPLQGYQNSNAYGQEQSLQNQPNTQMTGYQSNSFNTQNTQNFVSQPQSWQTSQTIQNQPLLPNQNQQTFPETTTPAQNIIQLQGFQNTNFQAQDQSLQNQPNIQVTEYNTQNVIPQPQSWQTFQSFQKPQQLTSNNIEGISMDNKNRLNTGIYQNNQYGLEQQTVQNQQPWQIKGNNQLSQNFVRPDASSIDIQQLSLNNDQSVQNQQLSSTGLKNSQYQNFPQQNQIFSSQQWLNQIPQNTQNQVQLQNPNQQTFFETSFQNSNTQGQDQSWQNKLNTQPIQNQPKKLQSNQIFAFQPKQRLETSKQTQISLTNNPSSDMQTTQFGVNQQQEGLSSQTTDQRKTLDSIPTLLSGSWKSRS